MRAKDVLKHFQSVGHWVNWEKTRDVFLHGDPEVEVKGIATAWIPTAKAIGEAAQKGLNLFITHEPAFLPDYQSDPRSEAMRRDKKEQLDAAGITLLRCHDTWDRMPEVGIPDAWARWLGFDTEPRPVESFYKICLLGEMTAREAAAEVLERTRELGQQVVRIFGDADGPVSRMAVGTGAITRLPAMLELGADVILATDDGMNSWTGGLWAIDGAAPVLVVNHATAEKPGMMAMADYLREQFPDVPAEYIDVEYPPKAVW